MVMITRMQTKVERAYDIEQLFDSHGERGRMIWGNGTEIAHYQIKKRIAIPGLDTGCLGAVCNGDDWRDGMGREVEAELWDGEYTWCPLRSC